MKEEQDVLKKQDTMRKKMFDILDKHSNFMWESFEKTNTTHICTVIIRLLPVAE